MPNNPIRIVPLAGADTRSLAPAAAPPKLTYRGGPLIKSVKIFNVFWGSAWKNKPELQATSQKLDDFFRFIVISSLIDELAEYNVPGQAIQHGRFIGSANVRSPAPRAKVKDASVRSLLQKQIANGHNDCGWHRCVMQPVLRLSQQYRQFAVLCSNALPRLQWLSQQFKQFRCTDWHQFP